jgi:hypothetical protein
MQHAAKMRLLKFALIAMLLAGTLLPIASIFLSYNGDAALAHALLACEGIVIFVAFNTLMAVGLSMRRAPYLLMAWPILIALILLMFVPERWVPSWLMDHPLSTILVLLTSGWILVRLERRRQNSGRSN